MDKIDKKILLCLLQNSRQSITQIAKQVRASRDVVNHRMARMVKQGVIRDFITDINYRKLGYVSALFFVSLKADVEEEFIAYISGLDFISWAGTQLGFWSLGMAIFGKDIAEVEQRFQSIFLKYKRHITNHQLAFYKNISFFSEKYFGVAATETAVKKYEEYAVDSTDKIILRSLAKNSRLSCVELGRRTLLTPAGVAKRINRLEAAGYITGYSIYINVLKLNRYLFIFFIRNNDLDQRKKLLTYLRQHPKVPLLIDYVGDPFIEFGIFVDNPYETRSLIQQIKEAFPDNELVDFFLTQEDFISFGSPACIFE